MRAAGALLTLLAVLAVTAEALARIGSGFLAWCSRSRLSAVERYGASLLLGIGVLGTAYLGLGATGLFYPALLLGAAALLIAGSRTWRERSSVVGRAVAGWAGAAGGAGAGLVGLALLPSLVHLLPPDMNIDVWCYHFALPWQCLQNHRMITMHTPVVFHLSLPVDMTLVLGILGGDVRFAKGLMLLCFAAATATWARPGRTGAALWVPPVLALGTGHMEELLGCGKNDLAAAAMLVGGAGLVSRGAWSAGAWVLGWSAAAKVVHLPLAVLLLVLAWRPPARAWLGVALGLAAPSAGWGVKEWLATGHPTAAFVAPGFLPAFDWDATHQAAYLIYAQAFWAPDMLHLATLPGAWFKYLRIDHLVLLVLLPGLALVGRGTARRAAVACALGLLVTIGGAHSLRYLLAGAWLLAALTGARLAEIPGSTARLAVPLLAGVSLLRIALGTDLWQLDWRHVLEPAESSRLLTTYGEAVGWLKSVRAPRVLDVGEMRTYLLPGRIVYAGAHGETPLLWQAARESQDAARMEVKMNQLGASVLLYNYVSGDWLASRYVPFPWDDRMLTIYRAYAVSHFERINSSEGNDFVNGGFCLFRIHRRAIVPRPTTIWFLPGTESVFAEVIRLEAVRDLPATLAASLRLTRLMPEVGHVWNQAGHAYALMGDSVNAFACLVKFPTMTDQLNQPELGWAALRNGKVDMAEKLLRGSLKSYSAQTGTIYLNLAQVVQQRVSRKLSTGKPGELAAQLAEAERYLELVPVKSPNLALVDARRRVQATEWALKAEIHRMAREDDKMVVCLREALRIAPEDAMAPRWKAEINRVAPQTFSLGGGR